MRWKMLALRTMAGIPLVAAGCTVSHQAARTDQEKMTSVQAEVQQLSAGKVVETMNSGGYTYVLISDGTRQSWAAVPQTEIAVGDEVVVGYGVDLKNFTSRTLGRRFDNIIFADGLRKAGEAAAAAGPAAGATAEKGDTAPSGHPAVAGHPAHAGQKAHSAEAAAGSPVGGKVVETMNSGGYTYICLENDGARTWAAIPPTEVSLGQELRLQPGMEMTSFTSKTLQRTFDRIIFSSGPAI